jgi:hypothetical protein
LGDVFSTPERAREILQIEAMFKKNKAFTDKTVESTQAMASFWEAECRCSLQNQKLDALYCEPGLLAPDLVLKLNRASAYIRSVLGPFRTFLDGLPSYVRVTPGATATTARKESRPYMKMDSSLDAPPSAEKYLRPLNRLITGTDDIEVRSCCFNRVEVVPKNWKTGRTIACEPSGVLPLQLAFDGYVKDRLRRRGIDLSDQSKNRELARQGSIDGLIATVDLSSASDNIAYNTVAWLLPDDWFEYLCDVRSPLLNRSGVLHRYEKFSSMGNGSTFALETLIFAAACSAVGSQNFSVYGDDIIIGAELYEDLSAFLRFLGFVINDKKSFSSGPFRESCGGNFYQGVDITPFKLIDVDQRKASWCHIINGLAGVAKPEGALWKFLASVVTEEKLPLVPFVEDSLTGVWIDSKRARALGVLHRPVPPKDGRRNSYQIDEYRGYITVSTTAELRYHPLAHKALALTHFMMWQREWMSQYDAFTPALRLKHTGLRRLEASDPLKTVVGGRDTTPGHKFRKTRRPYQPPSVATPPHLYWWGGLPCRKYSVR